MPNFARIECDSRAGVGNKWLNLIDSHAALGHPPPVIGINPFTQQPQEFYAPGSTAEILKDGVRVGSIEWAMDESPWLLVHAEDDSAGYVTIIAEHVAATLSGRFVLETITD